MTPAQDSVVLLPGRRFNGVQVFAATTFLARQELAERVTAWLAMSALNEMVDVIEIVVRQSSDQAFHCLTFVVFFSDRGADSSSDGVGRGPAGTGPRPD